MVLRGRFSFLEAEPKRETSDTSCTVARAKQLSLSLALPNSTGRVVPRITRRRRTERGPRPLLLAPFSNSPSRERRRRRRRRQILRIASDATRAPPRTRRDRFLVSRSLSSHLPPVSHRAIIARRRTDHPTTLLHRIAPRHCPRCSYAPAVMADRD